MRPICSGRRDWDDLEVAPLNKVADEGGSTADLRVALFSKRRFLALMPVRPVCLQGGLSVEPINLSEGEATTVGTGSAGEVGEQTIPSEPTIVKDGEGCALPRIT